MEYERSLFGSTSLNFFSECRRSNKLTEDCGQTNGRRRLKKRKNDVRECLGQLLDKSTWNKHKERDKERRQRQEERERERERQSSRTKHFAQQPQPEDDLILFDEMETDLSPHSAIHSREAEEEEEKADRDTGRANSRVDDGETLVTTVQVRIIPVVVRYLLWFTA
jgi:hypothetical protein